MHRRTPTKCSAAVSLNWPNKPRSVAIDAPMKVFLLTACCLALFACEVSEKSLRPDLDGPGSWGPLQDTVLLEDLELVETKIQNGQWHAYVHDPSGHTHDIMAGDFMGENTGRVLDIREDILVIIQIVQDGQGGYIEARVEFAKR